MTLSIALVTNTHHHNAARLMIDCLILAVGQSIYQEIVDNLSVRIDVPDFTTEGEWIKPIKIEVNTRIADKAKAARK